MSIDCFGILTIYAILKQYTLENYEGWGFGILTIYAILKLIT